ncbi:MAG: hypothetical protein PHU71_03695 [Candidatus Gracilibacteria bacterium]|nr:hypothetical protein [Candidatus Gracilibacteria bacterium]
MRQQFFKRQPKYLLTYLCHQCELDFTSTELTQPECFYCGSQNGFTLLNKEKFIRDNLKVAEERMSFNLKNVYEA